MRRQRPATEQVSFMKHASTRIVYDYWNTQRGHRAAPERADIDPTAIRHALGDTFILAADFVDQLRFRLAGTRVCALFAREIKGEGFGALWSEASRETIDDLLGILINEKNGVVAGVSGRTADGAATDLEMLLLPLGHSGQSRTRALGVLAPLVPPYWLGAAPVAALELGALRHIGPRTGALPLLVPEPDPIRVRHGFTIYSGGRESAPEEQLG
jgi:hypothetical protein